MNDSYIIHSPSNAIIIIVALFVTLGLICLILLCLYFFWYRPRHLRLVRKRVVEVSSVLTGGYKAEDQFIIAPIPSPSHITPFLISHFPTTPFATSGNEEAERRRSRPISTVIENRDARDVEAGRSAPTSPRSSRGWSAELLRPDQRPVDQRLVSVNGARREMVELYSQLHLEPPGLPPPIRLSIPDTPPLRLPRNQHSTRPAS